MTTDRLALTHLAPALTAALSCLLVTGSPLGYARRLENSLRPKGGRVGDLTS